MNLGDYLAIKGWCSCVTIFIKSIQCPTFGVQTLESDKYEYNACSVKTQSFLASTRSIVLTTLETNQTHSTVITFALLNDVVR